MFAIIFKLRFYIFMLTMFAVISCDKEGLEIPNPSESIEYSATGLVDGMPLSIGGDGTIMLTTTRMEGGKHIYSGKLIGCDAEAQHDCGPALQIEFQADQHVLNTDTYPTILEPGGKAVAGQNVFSSSPQLCLSFPFPSIVNIDNSLFPWDEEYCREVLTDYPEFTNITVSTADVTGGYPSVVNFFDIKVSKRNNEVIYYYFKFDCLSTSPSCLIGTLSLEGNSDFTPDDFLLIQDSTIVSFNTTIKDFPDADGQVLLDFEIQHLTDPNLVNHLVVFGSVNVTGGGLSICESLTTVRTINGNGNQIEGAVNLIYTDEVGVHYSSHLSSPSLHSFIVNQTERHVIDGNGNQTVNTDISYDGPLESAGGKVVEFQNTTFKIAIGY